MAPENNTVPTPPAPIPTTPEPPVISPQPNLVSPSTSTPPQAETTAPNPTPTIQPHKASWLKGKMLRRALLVLIVVLAVAGAFLLGRQHPKIVYRDPPLQPINLPPQAIVTEDCVPGRGKQYIIPKDIPLGPIYDVENSKVIAVEYNLNLADVETNPDSFSDILLQLTKNYPVDHFAVFPVIPEQTGEPPTNLHLVMFVVSKAEANSITCGAKNTNPSSTSSSSSSSSSASQQPASGTQ